MGQKSGVHYMGEANRAVTSIVRFGSVALLVAALFFVGCSGGNQAASSSAESAGSSSESSTASQSSGATDPAVVVGVDDGKAYNCIFTNETGLVITNVAPMPAGALDEPVFLMESGQQVDAGQALSVFAQPVDGSAVFDVVFLAGEGRYTLHNVDFQALSKADVRLEGEIAYLTSSTAEGETSTLQAEKDMAQAAADEAAAAAAAEQAAAEQAAAEAAAAQPYVPPAAPAAPAQTGDRCVEDVVLR